MLYSVDKKQMDYMPHRKEYDERREKLSNEDYYRAVDAINEYIDGHGDVFTSSFIPGKDWSDTPYDPLYRACNQSMDQAALFFGQIVWETVMNRDDAWIFMPADKDFDDVIGMKYFRPTDR